MTDLPDAVTGFLIQPVDSCLTQHFDEIGIGLKLLNDGATTTASLHMGCNVPYGLSVRTYGKRLEFIQSGTIFEKSSHDNASVHTQRLMALLLRRIVIPGGFRVLISSFFFLLHFLMNGSQVAEQAMAQAVQAGFRQPELARNFGG